MEPAPDALPAPPPSRSSSSNNAPLTPVSSSSRAARHGPLAAAALDGSPAPTPEHGAHGAPAPLPPSKDDCDMDEDQSEPSRLDMMSQLVVKSESIQPFLRKHVPGQYGLTDKALIDQVDGRKKPDSAAPPTTANSKYCYRHRPDAKCRRQADEEKMAMIQTALDKLPPKDQQAITHVWTLFSAAPARHRDIMLQGIMTQCCFPQLSTVAREVQEQLKIDFITALPPEVSYKILSYLDTVSLCKAAQVSRRWRLLADADVVWHHMCEQHIDRKCAECGWGLPLLERKRLRDFKKQLSAAEADADDSSGGESGASIRHKRGRRQSDRYSSPKRRRFEDADVALRSPLSLVDEEEEPPEPETRFRPWKDVYRDRFKVGSNWKYGRYSTRVFRGHDNGVTCLQFDDHVLATGSYDATIRIWNVETGEELRVLRGHASCVRSLHFDDSKLISGSLDRTVKVWNWRTGECVCTLGAHSDGVISVHLAGDLLASGSIDRTIQMFNFKTKQTWALRGHSDWVNQVRIDDASRTLLSASDDCSIRLWDIDSRVCIREFNGHNGHVQQAMLMPPDFEPLFSDLLPNEALGGPAAESRGGTPSSETPSSSNVNPAAASFFPFALSSPFAETATPVAAPPSDETRAAYGPSFVSDPDRPLPPRYIMSAGLDLQARLWDTKTGRCLRTFFGHMEGIWGLAGDTLRVVTGANDGMVKVWDPRTGRCEHTFTGHRGPVACVGLSDSLMASGGDDGEVIMYNFHADAAGSAAGGPTREGTATRSEAGEAPQ